MRYLALFTLLTTSSLLAQDGKDLYSIYCSACHAPDGKGASNGLFPPLARSEWVRGTPERMIQIVLRGLQGPIQAVGKNYNLVMPPQGATLTDEQISKIITYVRSSWGHQETPVTTAQIKTARLQHPDQTSIWDAHKLLKHYPLETPKRNPHRINDLLSHIHHGKFKSLQELRASEAENVEEEKEGFISLDQSDRKNYFGLVWNGWLNVPQDGRYHFTFSTDDGGALTINGQEIITRDRIGPATKPSRKSINLKKGRADIKIEYFEYSGKEEITLFWHGPEVNNQPLHKKKPKKRTAPSIPLVPPTGEALIYRNFIAGSDARGIGVGYSEGVNLLFSAETMALDLIWTGKFINAARHWTNRGQGFEKPAGNRLIPLNRGIPFNLLESQTTSWNSKADPKLAPRFRGYRLNAKQQPTFMYEFGDLSFTDEILPSGAQQLTRTIHITIPKETPSDTPLYFRALSGAPVTSTGERSFTFISEQFSLEVLAPSPLPLIRNQELLIPIPLGQATQTIKLTYTWK